jgi:quercetin dioxygenase-like cupin family protein
MSAIHICAARLFAYGLVAVLVGFGATRALAAEETAMSTATDELSYVRLYPGADGVSHFAKASLNFVPLGVPGVEAVLSAHRLGDVRGAMLARLKAGATEDWHPAPRRQFMFCLRGIVEVTAGDGETRRLRPGEFLLLEDVTGKGHRTHAAGPDDHVALAIPVESTMQP